MTTADELVNEDGTTNTDNFATGAGQVDVRRMADPGLVYDAGVEDWYGFLQGAGALPVAHHQGGLHRAVAQDLQLAIGAADPQGPGERRVAGQLTAQDTDEGLQRGGHGRRGWERGRSLLRSGHPRDAQLRSATVSGFCASHSATAERA